MMDKKVQKSCVFYMAIPVLVNKASLGTKPCSSIICSVN